MYKSRLNLMKAATIVACLAVIVFTSCGGGSGSSGGGNSAKIKMTTESGGGFGFRLCGSGVATVDWGDGSEKTTLTLNENFDRKNFSSEFGVSFEHIFPSATIRTISISGDNITGLMAGNLTNLDVSKNTELIWLSLFGTKLKSLEVSKNTALSLVEIFGDNQITAAALNVFFETLHSNTVPPAPGQIKPKLLIMGGNPGAADCDRSIAERKGWTVDI